MRIWILALFLLLATGAARAADVCPAMRNQQAATDPATRIAAVACNEHMLWYRPFIDRHGRVASSAVSEAESSLLGDGQSQPWRRVAGYWQGSGLLPQMSYFPGAADCGYAAGNDAPSPACRAFVVDQPWSAAFVSWVMIRAGVPGFRASASHIDYVRDAALHSETSAYQYLDPTRTRPAAGDLLCYVRQNGRVYGYAGLLTASNNGNGGLAMHCEIVVAANPGNDSTAYLIGGNVQQGVTMRLLPLNRNGVFWGLPQRAGGEPQCSPDDEDACNFNRQDWAVLLKLKPTEQLAKLPGAGTLAPYSAPPAETPEARQCCVNCVVGSGVPRCPSPAQPVAPPSPQDRQTPL